MKRPTVHQLLLFLVVWAFANDAWAAVTPERSDDVVAAEDNQYLLVSPDFRLGGRAVKAWPVPDAGEHALPPLAPETGLRLCPALTPADSPGVRSLIYLLMTLRR
jgi:hypothetical protein